MNARTVLEISSGFFVSGKAVETTYKNKQHQQQRRANTNTNKTHFINQLLTILIVSVQHRRPQLGILTFHQIARLHTTQ